MAQLNRASFVSKWATLFADNVTKDISEQDLRDFRQDIADSIWFQLDEPLDEYWPLGGAATLTDNFALDGDGNDLAFIGLGSFELLADTVSIDVGEALVTDWYNITVGDGNFIFQFWDSLGNVSQIIIEDTITIDSQVANLELYAAVLLSLVAPDILLESATTIRARDNDSIALDVQDDASNSIVTFGEAGGGNRYANFIIPPQLPSYTVGTLPAAATYPRGLVWVSDETDGACEAISNGTNWVRTYDGTIVS